MSNKHLQSCVDMVEAMDRLGLDDVIQLAKFCRTQSHDLSVPATQRRIYRGLATLFKSLKG